MHILIRKSFFESTSQALAWQTTSRSAGLVNNDRSQNVFGSGANPSDVKNPSPYRTIPCASVFRSWVVALRRLRRIHQLIDVVPFLAPKISQQVCRNRPVRRNKLPVIFLSQLPSHIR